MRAFFAIISQDELHQRAMDVIRKNKQHHKLQYVRWTHATHLHITMRFLGELDETKLNDLIEHTQQQITLLNPFEITAHKLIFLPKKRPRILGLAIQLNNELAQLAVAIQNATDLIEYPREKRPLLPHITLARFKNPLLSHDFDLALKDPVTQTVNSFVLYKSEPNQEGSDYTVLHEFNFDDVDNET